MNVILAFTLFSLIILIYWIISEFFTMLFRFTGVPDEKARFQVVSLLTGAGYTTRESELFVSTKTRRRLARMIMLFGYVFNVTFISALINVFISFKSIEHAFHMVGMIIPLISVAIIFLFMRIPKIHACGEFVLEQLVGRLLNREDRNSAFLLDYIGNDSIVQLNLKRVPERFVNQPLSQMRIKADHGILVMLVDRGGDAVPADADTVFQPGDKLTVFGNYAAICNVFEAQEQFSIE